MKSNEMTYVYDRALGKHVWKDRRTGMTGQGMDLYGVRKPMKGTAVLTFDGAGVAPVSKEDIMKGVQGFVPKTIEDTGTEISRQLQKKLNFQGRIDKLITGKAVMIM